MRWVWCGLCFFLVSCETSQTAPTAPTPTSGTRPAYDRDDWGGWIDADGDCLNTRQEVLLEESLGRAFAEHCRVVTGQWRDLFTGRLYENPADLDIDHLVSLKDAHDSGGWRWDAMKKKQYANDLSYPHHLLAVGSSVNRSKGAHGPDAWTPPTNECWYEEQYQTIKRRWGLTMTAAQREAVASC